MHIIVAGERGHGSTALVGLLVNDTLYMVRVQCDGVIKRGSSVRQANIGDSRAVICRGGQAEDLSRPHTTDLQGMLSFLPQTVH